MTSSIRYTLVAILANVFIHASATSLGPQEQTLYRRVVGDNLRAPKTNDTRIDNCYSQIELQTLYNSRPGAPLCESSCLNPFPQLSHCCEGPDASGSNLTVEQADACMYQYAVWTQNADGSVTIYPSSTRAAQQLTTETTAATAGSTAVANTAAPAVTTTANASNGANNANKTQSPATTTSGSPSKTAAAAGGPTTSNGVDKLAFSHEQQIGTVGLGFVWLLSALLL